MEGAGEQSITTYMISLLSCVVMVSLFFGGMVCSFVIVEQLKCSFHLKSLVTLSDAVGI